VKGVPLDRELGAQAGGKSIAGSYCADEDDDERGNLSMDGEVSEFVGRAKKERP